MFVTIVYLLTKIVIMMVNMTLDLTSHQNPLIKFLGNPLPLHFSCSPLDPCFSFSPTSYSQVTWEGNDPRLTGFWDLEFLPSSQDFTRLELHTTRGGALQDIALRPSLTTEEKPINISTAPV